MSKYSEYPDEVVYAVASHFLPRAGIARAASDDGKIRTTDIANEVNKEFGQSLTREQIYPLLAEARRRGFFLLCPPPHINLVQRIIDCYEIDPERRNGQPPVQVVNVRGKDAMGDVSVQAAKVAHGLVMEFAERKRLAARRNRKDVEPVRVGLASGWSTAQVSRRLAGLLSQETEPPLLAIHALSSGFSVTDPAMASVSFFNFFHGLPKVEYVGLFANPYAPGDEYDTLVAAEPTVATAFAYKDDIDLVISSLASSGDDHGELLKFIRGWTGGSEVEVDAAQGPRRPQTARARDRKTATKLPSDKMSEALLKEIDARVEAAQKLLRQLQDAGWVGDVQYRPYSKDGPITQALAIKAVTMFELDELVQKAAHPNKAVLLIAGPCGRCGNPRHEAVKPLLSQPSLRVWSHLVMDAETAANCISPSA